MSVKSLYNSIVDRRLRRLLLLEAESSLFSRKRKQQEDFIRLRPDFSRIYSKIEENDVSRYTTPLWQNYNRTFCDIFLPEPRFAFLRSRIMSTMFVDACGKWLSEELSFLEETSTPEILRELLEEDYVGLPTIRNHRYLTSHNSIHHLYHIACFQNKTGIRIDEHDSVIEWGGGYGNMAKIVKRINDKITYIIVDTPLFSSVQWIYLSTILGTDQVNIIAETTDAVANGKINIVPLHFLDVLKMQADVFIATWSLSESSKYAQDYVESSNFFNSNHLLLAFQESSSALPDAGRLGHIAERNGARLEAIGFLPNNYYAFR